LNRNKRRVVDDASTARDGPQGSGICKQSWSKSAAAYSTLAGASLRPTRKAYRPPQQKPANVLDESGWPAKLPDSKPTYQRRRSFGWIARNRGVNIVLCNVCLAHLRHGNISNRLDELVDQGPRHCFTVLEKPGTRGCGCSG
jgi:hypothetical protein